MHFELILLWKNFRGLIGLFSKINIMSLYALWNVYNGNYKTLEVYIKKIMQSRYARPYNVFICTPLEFYNFHYIHFKVRIILHLWVKKIENKWFFFHDIFIFLLFLWFFRQINNQLISNDEPNKTLWCFEHIKGYP